MFTMQFDENTRRPKYEQLYRHVRDSITAGALKEGTKLPSKRKLSAHLAISMNTVESAYAQLTAEGYVEPVEKRGYFVLPVAPRTQRDAPAQPAAVHAGRRKREAPAPAHDLKNNAVDTGAFPFSTWSRLMRDSLREDHAELLKELHPQGDTQLREEIAGHLREYRNIRISPERIILGAGSVYLLGILTELLPRRKFAIEDPGYYMIARTLQSRNVPFDAIATDDEGMRSDMLRKSRASVCFLTPSNQFPLGTVMTIGRRTRLLDWAAEKPDRYLVEDDYDSDYRYALKPAPALHSLDHDGRVVYLNTFARTLTPSLRIAYMVLPESLMETYWPRRKFHSCTVSGFEQRTLWRFLRDGHYERHLNRMRTIYKRRRNILLRGLSPLSARLAVSGSEAGLHLLLRSRKGMTEAEMVRRAAARDVRVYGLSGFYHNRIGEMNTVVAGYGGLREEDLGKAAAALCRAWAK